MDRGRGNGLLMAFLGAVMWTVGDIASERQFSTSWIPWANAVTRWMTYSLVAILAAQILRMQFEREHEHASHDALTGLQNRRTFFYEVERSKR